MVRKQIIVENYRVLRKNQKIEKAHRVSGSLARKYRSKHILYSYRKSRTKRKCYKLPGRTIKEYVLYRDWKADPHSAGQVSGQGLF